VDGRDLIRRAEPLVDLLESDAPFVLRRAAMLKVGSFIYRAINNLVDPTYIAQGRQSSSVCKDKHYRLSVDFAGLHTRIDMKG